MDVKEAVELAKLYIADVYSNENIRNVGLEEIDYDDSKGIWYVTIGFSRPWDAPFNTLAALAIQDASSKRTFKTLRISDATRKVLSIKNRDRSS